MLRAFLQHRQEVVTRRTLYLLRRARQRGHIEGQAVAPANIDAVVERLKTAVGGRGAGSVDRASLESQCVV